MRPSEYYRLFVKDFSLIAAPLYGLMKKRVDFQWTAECQEAFDELKHRLMTGLILALPENDGTFLLDTDVADTGMSAVLSQFQSGEEKVIAYASRTMSNAEKSYATTRKKLLAVVYGLKQFRQYLLGRHIIIRICIDYAALSWLRHTPEPMPQMPRWLTLIEQFDYEVAHRLGKKHGNADGLSRRPFRDDEGNPSSMESQNTCPTFTQTTTEIREEDELSQEEVSLIPTVQAMQEGGDVVTPLVGKCLHRQQQDDSKLGDVVKMRLANGTPPSKEKLQIKSEVTKKMVTKWEDLEIYEGLVYRRKKSPRDGEADFKQLLRSRTQIEEALHQCHAGTVAEHFGIQKTMNQVCRKFYWPTWKEDTRRFCQPYSQCTSYHRGKINKTKTLAASIARCAVRTMVHRPDWSAPKVRPW